jgi:multicomponent Na+:H+ antiporter subunit D
MEAMLPPLPVALPMVVAAVLLSLAFVWPRRVPDAVACLTALAVAALGVAVDLFRRRNAGLYRDVARCRRIWRQPGIAASFCLLLTGLLIKAAMVPFQLWLADTHALAPSPVCVIFSGVMVPMAIYGATKLGWEVFGADAIIRSAAETAMPAAGVASAIVGGAMCLAQRHVKRLLAFSTISHAGIMLIGCSVFSAAGEAGTLLYMLGMGW